MINMEGRTILTSNPLLILMSMKTLLFSVWTSTEPTCFAILEIFKFVGQPLVLEFELLDHHLGVVEEFEPLIFGLLILGFDSINVEPELLFYLSNKWIVTPICLRI